ncbi:MAG: DUF3105 domain-containing protein [Thermomicrobiales bacterium]
MPQPSSKKSGSAAKSTQSVRQSVDNETAREKSDETKSRAQRRQEQFDQRREERRKAPSRQKRERLIVRAVLGGIAVLLIAGVAWEVISYVGSRDERQQPDNVKTYAYAGGDHTYDTVDYAESPPVGGVHDPVWQTCDFYDGVVRNENAVHCSNMVRSGLPTDRTFSRMSYRNCGISRVVTGSFWSANTTIRNHRSLLQPE